MEKQLEFPPTHRRYRGSVYDPAVDNIRLDSQMGRVWNLMRDGAWRSLHEIAVVIGDPEASISAQLRHLRKRKWGYHHVDRRNRGDREEGLFEYRLIPNLVRG